MKTLELTTRRVFKDYCSFIFEIKVREMLKMKRAMLLSVCLALMGFALIGAAFAGTWFSESKYAYFVGEGSSEEWADIFVCVGPENCVLGDDPDVTISFDNMTKGGYVNGSKTVVWHYCKMVDISMVLLDYNGKDFYMSGTLNMTKRVYIHTLWPNITITEEVFFLRAPCELWVTGNWTDFAVDIEGIGMLSGKVLDYVLKYEPENPVSIARTDVNHNRKIDILDVAMVAYAYGSTSGSPRYDPNLDFNSDSIINVVDLAAVARNFGETY